MMSFRPWPIRAHFLCDPVDASGAGGEVAGGRIGHGMPKHRQGILDLRDLAVDLSLKPLCLL
jgi:hypothetical protein